MKKMFVVLMAIFAIIGFVGLVGCPTDDEGGPTPTPTPTPPMATLSVSPSEVIEGETTTATVMLDNALDADASFTLVFGNTANGDDVDADVDGTLPDDTSLSGGVTITAGDTRGTATITTVDDSEQEGDETFTVRLMAGPEGVTLSEGVVTVTIIDTDTAGITVSGISGATDESGGTATFTVRLNTQPTADVTVTPTSSDTGEGTVSGALTFTAGNWGTAQTITVTGVDDSLVDGNQTYQIEFTVASADGDYNGFTLTPVDVTNSDDDSAGITVGSISGATSESGETATFTVRLNTQPTANVVVTPTSSDTGEGTVSGALTFSTSNWNTAQTITVTGVDDSLVDGILNGTKNYMGWVDKLRK